MGEDTERGGVGVMDVGGIEGGGGFGFLPDQLSMGLVCDGGAGGAGGTATRDNADGACEGVLTCAA